MPQIQVDGITFTFPVHWQISKYDDWGYYRDHFTRMRNGIKGIDLLALDPTTQELCLIEVKDFRRGGRKKEIPLHEEIFTKVFDTLAALLPSTINANNVSEKNFAKSALSAKKIHIVFHGEQPLKPSKLFPSSYISADLLQILKKMLKAIDPHPRVVCASKMLSSIPWQVNV